MESPAPQVQPEKEAGVVSADGGAQPASGNQAASVQSQVPLPSVPDHELLRCIGRGAYGAVWLARNVMATFRAVKIVHREDFMRDRPFIREYEGLLNYEPISRSHPNLMQILHVGRRDSYFYYVTELADDASETEVGSQTSPADRGQKSEGGASGDHSRSVASYVPRTLQEDLERRGRLPVRECVGLATALASALKHLHNHSLVHRDVKPSNVIFVHGIPKLADIGLVATAGDSQSIVGTEGYLPPEGPGNPQADLYSLGKLLYEASSGLGRGEYPRLPRTLAALPDAQNLLEFNEVLLKACAKDTHRRYQQAEDLLADLALLERGESVKRLRRLERHSALLKRAGVGLLAVGLVLGAAWWQTRRAHRIATRHLAQLQVNEGTREMVGGNYLAALPWLVGALALESGDPVRQRVHRTRIAGVLARCPLPVAHFAAPGSKVVSADLSPDGLVVATAHQDWSVRLWDARSGERIGKLPHEMPVSFCQFLPSGDRLLTVTMGQQALVWNWKRPDVAPLTFRQGQGQGSVPYAVGLNSALGKAYLSKGAYVYPHFHTFTNEYENLTLSLKLVGRGEELLVQHEVCHTGGDGAVLDAGEFLDTPKAEALDRGAETLAAPIWGRVLLILENGSWGESPTNSSQVIWDNLRMRRYRSGEKEPPWQMLDNFSSGSLSNWVYIAAPEEGRTCEVINGQLVLSCARLPQSQTVSGCLLFAQPAEITRNDTLEVAVDLISARAPYRMVSLDLVPYLFDPLTAPDRTFVLQGRWLATTWLDTPLRLFDLEEAQAAGVSGPGRKPLLELGRPDLPLDVDFSPDMSQVALVGSKNDLSVWNLSTRQEVVTDATKTGGANGARFSPDGRFLAVSHGHVLALIGTSDWQVAHALMQGSFFAKPRFAPMGNRLAAVRDKQDLVVWSLDELPEPSATFPHPSEILRLAFSPDGRYLATSAADDVVRIWDVVRGKAFGPPLPGALGRFSPDGTQLLVIGGQGVTWLWDLSRIGDGTLVVPPLLAEQKSASSADGVMTAEIEGQGIVLKLPVSERSLVHPVPLRRVGFTPGDEYVIAEGSDQLARVWHVPTLTLVGPPCPVRYDVLLTNQPQFEHSLERRSLRELRDLAALLGGQRPGGTGGIMPVDETERVRIFGERQRANPAEFAADEARRRLWHREQAAAAELAMDWEAAVFHWERAREGKAEGRGSKAESKSEVRSPKSEIAVESRLAYAREAGEEVGQVMLEGRSRWAVILPRPPWATAEMLDLSPFYTRRLGEPLMSWKRGITFRGLGSGVQVVGGTGFDVRGIVDLKLTNQVTIRVGRVCQRLHFLQAASKEVWGREFAATYQVTFNSGTNRVVTLRNPEELPPYIPNRVHQAWGTLWPLGEGEMQSRPAWAGHAPGLARRKDTLILTHTTWTLPVEHHGEVVESLELRAGSGESAPLIFAITVE